MIPDEVFIPSADFQDVFISLIGSQVFIEGGFIEDFLY